MVYLLILFLFSFFILSSFLYLLLWKKEDEFIRMLNEKYPKVGPDKKIRLWLVLRICVITVYLSLAASFFFFSGIDKVLIQQVVSGVGVVFLFSVLVFVPAKDKHTK